MVDSEDKYKSIGTRNTDKKVELLTTTSHVGSHNLLGSRVLSMPCLDVPSICLSTDPNELSNINDHVNINPNNNQDGVVIHHSSLTNLKSVNYQDCQERSTPSSVCSLKKPDNSVNKGEITLTVPNLSSEKLTDEPIEKSTVSIAEEGEEEEDEIPLSTSSSLSPSHCKLGGVVSKKAAAILGAEEIFTSPSHAAYRRLVDYTHRPLNEDLLLRTSSDNSKLPSLAHPSLTVRSSRKYNKDPPKLEASPEKKPVGVYKIINLGIDDMKENVKEKLNFLKKSSTDSSAGMTVSSPSSESGSKSFSLHNSSDPALQISPQLLEKWSCSFEMLLRDKKGLSMFHSYLKSEYSEENIEFWMACEEFKRTSVGSGSCPKKMAQKAQRIIQEYVCTQAHKEVNLDSKSRQITLEKASSPSPDMFDIAQKRIQTLMEIDSYQRFLRLINPPPSSKSISSKASNAPSSIMRISSLRTSGSGSSTVTSGSSKNTSGSSKMASGSGSNTGNKPDSKVTASSSSTTIHSSTSDNCLARSN